MREHSPQVVTTHADIFLDLLAVTLGVAIHIHSFYESTEYRNGPEKLDRNINPGANQTCSRRECISQLNGSLPNNAFYITVEHNHYSLTIPLYLVDSMFFLLFFRCRNSRNPKKRWRVPPLSSKRYATINLAFDHQDS